MNLKEYLDKTDCTVARFSRLIGVDRVTLAKILKGNSNPQLKIALKIVKATCGEVTLNDIAGLPQNPPKSYWEK